ncbi:MAG: hypothetical protein R3F62_25675 [Planctomycetota bacterium]
MSSTRLTLQAVSDLEPSYPWSWAVWGWRQLAARRGWSPLALPSLRYDPQVARPWPPGHAASGSRCA